MKQISCSGRGNWVLHFVEVPQTTAAGLHGLVSAEHWAPAGLCFQPNLSKTAAKSDCSDSARVIASSAFQWMPMWCGNYSAHLYSHKPFRTSHFTVNQGSDWWILKHSIRVSEESTGPFLPNYNYGNFGAKKIKTSIKTHPKYCRCWKYEIKTQDAGNTEKSNSMNREWQIIISLEIKNVHHSIVHWAYDMLRVHKPRLKKMGALGR